MNYRPVSLISEFCKVLETVIKYNLVQFLSKYKLVNTYQHGFLKARSCLANLICFVRK